MTEISISIPDWFLIGIIILNVITIVLKIIKYSLKQRVKKQKTILKESKKNTCTNYYPNDTSTGRECIHCGNGEYMH